MPVFEFKVSADVINGDIKITVVSVGAVMPADADFMLGMILVLKHLHLCKILTWLLFLLESRQSF